MKVLIYDLNYDFNPRCFLLGLLYQYTHKYNFLHQTLIDIVTQDINYQMEQAAASPSSTISNSFIIFQLHWESQQLMLNTQEQRKMKEQIRFNELQKKVDKSQAN
mmetsp:Transcript_35934/g.55198  ORF Transcript_35934/g.55198 Transcript_35934/m.55198 type:complete len:105 (-) Transcript_35934:1386-1700(-)